MPDVIDGLDGLLRRGHLGQAWAHTMIGAVVLCVPLGLLLTWLIARLNERWRRSGRLQRLRRFFSIAGDWCPVSTRSTESTACRGWAWTLSLLVGAVSHILFDCISHENCRWLAPWRDDSRCFPAWWYDAWFSVPLPFYREPYPFAPHTVMWCVLTIVGAALYFWPATWRTNASDRANADS